MGQRSYVLIDSAAGSVAVLESNNALPLLWVGLLSSAQLDPGLSEGPTMGFVEGAARGVTLTRGAALEQLSNRRDNVACWLGEDAAVVLDQLGAFLRSQPGTTLRIDLSEWVELSDNLAAATQELRDMLQALSTPPAKRRPKHVKQVLERAGLLKLPSDAPAFGVLLGGVACAGREPWRRDPPRERRRADDELQWQAGFDQQHASDDGRLLYATAINSAYVQTPVRWQRDGRDHPRLVPIADEAVGHVWANVMSGDGAVLFGTCHTHPGGITRGFRLDGAGMTLLGVPDDPPFIPMCTNTEGNCAGGWLDAKPGGIMNSRAAIWSESRGLRALPPGDAGSAVAKLSADGRVAAGTLRTTGAVQALVWEHDSPPTLVAEFFSLDWLALAPSGRCGVLRVMTGYGVDGDAHFWRNGDAARPMLDDAGKGLWALAVSPDVTLALGQGTDGISFWRPDRAPQQVLDADEARGLWPLHVPSSGDWFVAREIDPSTYATSAIVVWEPRRGLTRHALKAGGLELDLQVANRAETLDQLVVLGFVRRAGEPVMWTARDGVVRWGAVPRD